MRIMWWAIQLTQCLDTWTWNVTDCDKWYSELYIAVGNYLTWEEAWITPIVDCEALDICLNDMLLWFKTVIKVSSYSQIRKHSASIMYTSECLFTKAVHKWYTHRNCCRCQVINNLSVLHIISLETCANWVFPKYLLVVYMQYYNMHC